MHVFVVIDIVIITVQCWIVCYVENLIPMLWLAVKFLMTLFKIVCICIERWVQNILSINYNNLKKTNSMLIYYKYQPIHIYD